MQKNDLYPHVEIINHCTATVGAPKPTEAELVEEMARAIYEERWAHDFDEDENTVRKDDCRCMAKACIAVLKKRGIL